MLNLPFFQLLAFVDNLSIHILVPFTYNFTVYNEWHIQIDAHLAIIASDATCPFLIHQTCFLAVNNIFFMKICFACHL